MKTTLRTFALLLGFAGASSAFGQVVYSLDFGTGVGTHSSGVSLDFLPATPAGGGTARVRVGTGGGSISLVNPGNTSLGTGSELVLTAPTGGSVNKFSVYDFADAASDFYIKFEMVLSGGDAGNIYFFAGDGANFGDSNAFSGAQIFTGIRWQFGASDSIATSIRVGGSWVTTGLPSVPFAQNNVYTVEVFANNGANTLNYNKNGARSVAAATWDLWINGVLVGDNLGKAQLASLTAIDSFMIYGENSTGNVATLAIDNIVYGTLIPEPSAFAGVAGLAALGGAALRRSRRSASAA